MRLIPVQMLLPTSLYNPNSHKRGMKRALHICTFPAVYGNPGNDDEIKARSHLVRQQAKTFFHQSSGPVSGDAVTYFFTGKKSGSVEGQMIGKPKNHQIPIPYRLTRSIYPVKISFFSQYVGRKHGKPMPRSVFSL